jgi:glycosyltransferase involved in cell wall biosynthesis
MLRKGDRKHLLPDTTRLLLKRWIPSSFIKMISGGREASPITQKQRRAKTVGAKHQPPLLSPDSYMSLRKTRSLALSAQLFGGFSHQALKGLDELLRHPQSDRHERACAYWALARWHAVQKQPAEAVRYLHLLRRTSSHDGAMLRPRLLEIDCLLELGATAEALNAIFAASSTFGKLAEIDYVLANAYRGLGDSTAQLSWLNAPLIRSALGSMQRRDPALPLALSNIVVPSAGAVQDPTAGKVSVLLPAYNCATTLPFALDSILKQTWSNLEVLVVDDSSSDDTWCVIQRFASQDARVVPLRHDSNRGAYCCRNTALSKATGELVTVHDSDDWSHPEKLALQIRHLLETDSMFNVSYAVRVSTDLRVLVDPASGRVVRPNISSLMVRRESLRELGGWDEVRVGADGELISRLRARYRQKPRGPLPETALSFVLSSPTSLTSQSLTGLRSLRFGARREYKEAYENWHASEITKEKPNFYMPRTVRPFPVPKIMRVAREATDHYHVVFVSDFHSESVLQINLAMMVSADRPA